MTVDKLKDEMNDAVDHPRRRQLLHHAHQSPDRHAVHGHPHPGGDQGSGAEASRSSKRSAWNWNSTSKDSRDPQRLCRKGHHRLFSGFRGKREEAARYGLTVDDIQEVVQSAIGGMNLTTTVEGRERYPVNVRYARELRTDIEKLKRVLVPAMYLAAVLKAQAGSGMVQLPAAAASCPGASGQAGRHQDSSKDRRRSRVKKACSLPVCLCGLFSGRDVGGYVEEAKRRWPP